MSGPVSPWGPARHERLARLAPLPFVAVATILLTLIVFTPVLLSTDLSPLLTQGELAVDRLSGANWTKFYVLPLDPQEVRYDSIELRVGTGFAWSGSCPAAVPQWTNLSDNDSIVVAANTSSDPVVVWAEASYAAATGPVIYAGEFAFHAMDPSGPNPQLLMVPCSSATPGVTVPSSSVAFGDLPVFLPLVNYGAQGPP